MTDRQPLLLDSLDLRLIEELEADGRQSVSELAQRQGISWSTVADRIKKLEDEHVIRFLTLLHPVALGHPRQFLIAVNAPPSQIESVARRLAAVRQVYHVSIHTGRYDIFASVSLPQNEDLWQFVNSKLASITEISRAEVMLSLRIVKFSLSLLTSSGVQLVGKEPPLRKLDELDFRLLHHLRADPRASYAGVASNAGCSRATARRRLEPLFQDGTLRVVAVADPVRLGYTVRANIGLAIRPDMIDQAAMALAASPYTHHVIITTGSFGLLFTTFFKSHDDLSAFVREYLGTIPGIISHETMVLMNVTKDNFGADWGFGAGTVDTTRAG